MGLTGKVKSTSGVPKDLGPVRNPLIGYLGGQNFDTIFGGQDMLPSDAELAPYRALFEQQNQEVAATAKESTGNLTGSGFANTLGTALGRSASQQGASLADLAFQRDTMRRNRFVQALLGISTSGVGAPQSYYQPGLLDSIVGGAKDIATAYAGRPPAAG